MPCKREAYAIALNGGYNATVDKKRTIKLGGTTLDLVYTGRNHSDSSLVMFLPKEKIIFAVDFNAVGAARRRGWRSTIPIRSSGKRR